MKHTPMADPFDNALRAKIIEAAQELNIRFHEKGNGPLPLKVPRFSTRAESNMFRTWGADVINMSTAPRGYPGQ